MEKMNLCWDRFDNVKSAEQILKNNGLIAGASDTVPGFLAPLTQEGFDKLNRAKDRSEKPYLVLVADSNKAKQFTTATLAPEIATLMELYWPGPLTLILPSRKGLPSFLMSKTGSIALRVPKHSGLLQLLKQFDGLFSTSANKTTMPVPQSVKEIDPSIKQHVEAIITDVREKDNEDIKPSTILDCTGESIKVLRQGACSPKLPKKG